MLLPDNYRVGRPLHTLVEQQNSFAAAQAELHIFETHQMAEAVELQFRQPVLAAMLMGKKRMHLRDKAPFCFLPGESVLLPANELMRIDFPEANMQQPTKCLALALDEDMVQQELDWLNAERPREGGLLWSFQSGNFHFTHSLAVQQILQRLIFLFTEGHPSKDLFVGMALKELLLRVLQQENEVKIGEEDSRLAQLVQYIRQHLREELSVGELSKKACMSEAHFYRSFKAELGQSPNDFIQEERLKLAASLLLQTEEKIGDIALDSGFNSLSYFNRLFKRRYQKTPSRFRKEKQGR